MQSPSRREPVETPVPLVVLQSSGLSSTSGTEGDRQQLPRVRDRAAHSADATDTEDLRISFHDNDPQPA
jgi:hypothetical protein